MRNDQVVAWIPKRYRSRIELEDSSIRLVGMHAKPVHVTGWSALRAGLLPIYNRLSTNCSIRAAIPATANISSRGNDAGTYQYKAVRTAAHHMPVHQ